MNTIATTVIELVGVSAATIAIFSTGYAAYLASTGGRQNLKWDRIGGFGVLAPTIWIGTSALTAIFGAYNNLLPNSLAAGLYGGLICLLPASWLAHSVLEDIAAANSVSPSRETSRKSIPAPKKNSTLPPPPHRW